LKQALRECEFFLARYVPDPVKNEFVNIGVMRTLGLGLKRSLLPRNGWEGLIMGNGDLTGGVFQILRYMPDIVRGEMVNIGIVLYEVDKEEPRIAVRVTRNWRYVLCLDPDAPTEDFERMEEGIAEGIAENLRSGAAEPYDFEWSSALRTSLPISATPATAIQLTKSFSESLNALMQRYVEPKPYPGQCRSNRSEISDSESEHGAQGDLI